MNEKKPYYKSVTMWGIAAAVIATIGPDIGKAIDKKEISAELFFKSLGAGLGTAVAAYGRSRADKPLSWGKEEK